jgi:hypothetical protein
MQEGVLERSLSNLFYKLFPFVICRLGSMWKTLEPERKEKYYEMAKKCQAEHQAQYPSK